MRLKDKVAIVSGASRGIGRAIALRFVQEGARVVAFARGDFPHAKSAEHETGTSFTYARGDVAAREDCERIVSQTVALHGKIDILVNAAGFLGMRTGLVDITVDDWDKVFATNARGTFLLSKLVVAEMLRRGSGSIINVTSGVVSRPGPNWGAYLPSKYAIEGMTLMLSEELKESGIRVNMVDPGRTDTDMIKDAYPDIDTHKLKKPDEVAGAFVYLASDESKLITGTRIRFK